MFRHFIVFLLAASFTQTALARDVCNPTCDSNYAADSLLKELVGGTIANVARPVSIPTPPKSLPAFVELISSTDMNLVVDSKTSFKFPTFGKCSLSKTETVFRGLDRQVDEYFSKLFQSIAENSQKLIGVSIKLNRFDLWHGHLFVNKKVIGILFHAMEYPRLDEDFPYPLGYCQANSTVTYNAKTMVFRNALWISPICNEGPPKMWILDSSKREGLGEEPVFTMDETTLGTLATDVYYLPGKSPLAYSPYSKKDCPKQCGIQQCNL
ncbi:uncharacterized protein VTP21DRAFT_8859 [Calcarisporiella thermophila]|uniref:uncharacterized protein n=1 Tax=Calcarisporiella thermophila TaxID=911321 RepID=UPI0037426198